MADLITVKVKARVAYEVEVDPDTDTPESVQDLIMGHLIATRAIAEDTSVEDIELDPATWSGNPPADDADNLAPADVQPHYGN